ncbi:MFS transporter [Microbacterium sp. NIBRBAC000506063]|uniref:MFS transporter n=1 Tax=Microbacterium sp. NIBRBAC000506063 TaxID=2734618 RepID=UPI0021D43782|nr:MFS transporter [Microbacterium sp. NIBRBAC000506063]
MWSGQALSQFGAQITELAIPVLAVLILGATEFQLGLLNAAAVAAFLVVGLPAGAWIDRMRKRHVMIVADLVRALALAMLPLLWWLGVLEMWHLYAVALVLGIATVFFDVSYQSIVPSLVRPAQIAEANGKFESTHQIAGIAGPAIGGWLVGILMAPLAILATVATYIASLIALLFTRDNEVVAEKGSHDPILRSIGEGLRWVFGNRLLRRIVGTTAISNFFSTISFTLLPIFILRELGLSPRRWASSSPSERSAASPAPSPRPTSCAGSARRGRSRSARSDSPWRGCSCRRPPSYRRSPSLFWSCRAS